jgi:hypothetical protein
MCAVRLSTGMRNGMVGTKGIAEMFNGGFMKIYTGGQPASADYAETGTLLATIGTTSGTGANDGLVFGTAGGGAIPKSVSVWSGVIGAAGVAGWFRLYGTAGTTGTSASEVRMDGNVGVSGSDLVLANTSLTLNATLTIDTATFTQPAS